MERARLAALVATETFLSDDFSLTTWPLLAGAARELIAEFPTESGRSRLSDICACFDLPLASHVRKHLKGGEVLPDRLLRACDALAVTAIRDRAVDAGATLIVLCSMALALHACHINAAVSLSEVRAVAGERIVGDAVSIVEAATSRLVPFANQLPAILVELGPDLVLDEHRYWVPIAASAIVGRLISIKNFIAAGGTA